MTFGRPEIVDADFPLRTMQTKQGLLYLYCARWEGNTRQIGTSIFLL